MTIYSVIDDIVFYIKYIKILNILVTIDIILLVTLVFISFVKKEDTMLKKAFLLPLASINIFTISFIALKYLFSLFLNF